MPIISAPHFVYNPSARPSPSCKVSIDTAGHTMLGTHVKFTVAPLAKFQTRPLPPLSRHSPCSFFFFVLITT